MEIISESKLISGLKNKDLETIEFLVKNFYPTIKLFLYKKGIDNQKIKEIFNESLRILIKGFGDDKFEEKSKVTTYFFGICKKVMLQKLEEEERMRLKDARAKKIANQQEKIYYLLPETDREYYFHKFKEVVRKAGVKCDEIFELSFNGYTQNEIAEMLNTSSSYVAKRKCDCLAKIKELVKENKDIYNFFQNYQEWLISPE